MSVWENKKYPLGCRSCGRNDTKHHGLGLCQPCYKLPEIHEAAKNGTLVEFVFSEVAAPVESDVTILPPTGERRPGSYTDINDTPGEKEEEKPSGFAGLFRGKKKNKDTAPTTKEVRPKGAGRRVSTAETLADVWGAVGGAAQRMGHAPLGRYMQWQGTAAGEMLDEALAGTIVDRKLFQPAVKARGRLDVLVALLGPPVLILQIERNPQQAQMLLPMLKSAIRSSLPTMLPAMKKAQVREDKVNAAIKEMFPDLPDGVDPVDEVITQLFYNYVPDAPATESEYESSTQ